MCDFYFNFITLFFPNFCFFCKKYLNPSLDYLSIVCVACSSSLTPIYEQGYEICFFCTEKLNPPSFKCKDCFIRKKRMHVYYDRNISLFFFEKKVRKLINFHKFNFKSSFFLYYGKVCAEFYSNIFKKSNASYIVFVPHVKNFFFNQKENSAYYFAKGISLATGISLIDNLIVKVMENKKQSLLSFKERLENPKKVYALKDGIYFKSQNFFLIDDIFTTGATVNQIAKLLKINGANKVIIISLAKSSLYRYKIKRKKI